MTSLRPMRFIKVPARIFPSILPMPTKDPIQETSSTRTGKARGDWSVGRSLITGDIQPTPRPWQKVTMFTGYQKVLEGIRPLGLKCIPYLAESPKTDTDSCDSANSWDSRKVRTGAFSMSYLLNDVWKKQVTSADFTSVYILFNGLSKSDSPKATWNVYIFN